MALMRTARKNRKRSAGARIMPSLAGLLTLRDGFRGLTGVMADGNIKIFDECS